MKIKRKHIKILSVLLVVNLIGVLIYLSIKNYESEVYIDFKVSKIKFVAIGGSPNEFLDNFEFFSNIIVDSIQLGNCNILFKPKNEDGFNSAEKQSTSRNDIVLSSSNNLIFKNFSTPKNSKITLTRGENYVLIEVFSGEGSLDIISGKVSIGSNEDFVLSGRNIKFSGQPDTLDGYRRISIKTSKVYKNILFSSKRKFSAMLYTTSNKNDILLKNLQVNKVETIDVDKSKKIYQQESTLQSGNIEIMGVSFLKKSFLLENHILEKGDFLRINENDNYSIKEVAIEDDGLIVKIFGKEVRGLETGKTLNSINSISPSKLDFLIAEPYKNTLWKVIAFVLAQEFLFLFWKPLKNLIGIKNEKESNNNLPDITYDK